MPYLDKSQKIYLSVAKDGCVEVKRECDLYFEVGSVKDGRSKLYLVTQKQEVDLKFEVVPKDGG